ncbi:MAG: beta galactosidase jelly roll domain-containing protein [Bacteroidota bacterium]
MKTLLSFIILVSSLTLSAQDKIINLRGDWKFSIGDRASWAAKDYNDANWEIVRAPDTWEDQGFYGYDGFAWYRKTFEGRELSDTENYYLYLGYIDDADEVYINGHLIGYSGSFPPNFRTAHMAERKYHIPPEYINFNGENTIAVRVFDVTREGGILRGSLGIYQLTRNSAFIVDLQGIWDFKLGIHQEGSRGSNESWEKIMVPIQWEAQGYKHYDGFATYSRSFNFPADEATEDLVVILGKIDDFDETYFNGVKIGETRDNRRYGRSSSFSERRIYEIPEDLIKRGQSNTITILVEDMGNVGGIYKGPVGVTTKNRFYRYRNDY